MIILTTLLFIFIFTFGSCFNIDIDFPIIYSDTNPNSKINGSYFGFSVILYGGDNNLKPWIQIGAPRGHNTNHYDFFQPGLVYRCEIGQSCKLFLVDMRVNWPINTSLKHRSYSYVPKKDKAWVGAVMDIDDDHNRVVICAPRWINVNRDYYIQGACYWSNINQNVTRELLPLVNNKQIVKDEVYFYGMGQAGSSVHFPKTSVAQVVMGAPGVYNWKGTVVSYEDDAKMLTSRNILQRNDALYKIVTVPDAAKIKDVYSFSYLGYSISSGHFFSPNEISYVAGAPKYSYKGQILVFNFVPNNAQDIIIRQTRQGETLGEYFGASIGVADINGDKLDDLIIGAPHYTKKHDEGRIYIFYGNRRENLLKPVQSPFITGNYSGGQFGTAIQSLGDIDGDGCEDIAVGAPYEDEQHGVVYIYNGRKKGAPLTLSQRIEGKRLYFSLRGFGISFSKPADIDQNNFKDIAVGAYLSDNAVILRMRPTVILQMTVRSLKPRLDRNSTQFEIETCFSFSGRHLPSNLNISRKIVLDKELRRVYQHGHPIGSMEYADNVNVLNNQMTCHKIGIGIKKMQSGKSGWEPIEIYVSQELLEEKNPSTPILVDNGVQAADKFCKTCPVVNRFKSVRELKIDVPFALECGDDNRCDSDLQVFAKFIGLNKDQFIIGLYKTLSLQISVLNKKEPAYLTEIEVTLPENVYLSAKPAECDDKYMDNKLTIICLIDNPLEQGKMKNVTLELDTEAITDIKKEKLPFQINAKSNSDEVNSKDNNIIKNLFLVTDASIKIIGKTEKSVYYFGGDIFANTTHVYEVQKTGVSPLNEFTLNISIPVSYKINNQEIHFLAIHKPKGFQDRQILTCQWPEEFVKDTEVLEVENFNQNITNEARKKRAINSSNETEIFDFAPLDKILFINCSMKEIVCKTISCTIGPFRQSLKGASLQIKMVMNMTQIIEHVLANNESIYLSTDGRVKEIEGQLMDSARTSTAFVKEPEDNTVESWIIIVAVVCGILILLLIIMGLVKAGFFERKQKAELEALKQAESVAMSSTNGKVESDLVSEPIKQLFYDLLKDDGIIVTDVDIQAGSIKGDNYLGVIAKAQVTGKDKNGKTFSDSYIIKSAPRSEGLRKFAPIRLAYEREIYVYSKVLPYLEKFQKERKIKNPFASYAEYLKSSDEDKDEALIMKDMKNLGYCMQNRKQPLDINHVRLIIRELARYHSLSFALKDQEPEKFEEFAKNTEKNYFAEIELENFQVHADGQCDKAEKSLKPEDTVALEKFQAFRKKYMDAFTTLLEERCHPHSVIRHGDCWTNNFLFAYHDKTKPKVPTNLCFLDWQLSMVGPPVLDILYFTYACTDKKLRDEHYDQLLKDYFQTLKDFTKELGTDLEKYYTYEIMQEQFKTFGRYGLASGIMLLNILLSDSDEIPDINEMFDNIDENADPKQMFEAFSFESKNADAVNERIRDTILHVVDNGYL